ncbi:MAG: hypothetical protein ACKOE6_08540, partial [Flammeovirgaceae bacterium]
MPNQPSWRDFFSPKTLEQWIEAAQHELEGNNPFQQLTHTAGGLPIKPYYSKDNGPAATLPLLPASQTPFLGARAWHNLPTVAVVDAKKANGEALPHLQHGAD